MSGSSTAGGFAPIISVNVTYLEMHEAPGGSEHQLTTMRAESPPVSFYRYLYNRVGAMWGWFERRALDDPELSAVIKDPAVHIVVLYVGGVPAGYYELDGRFGNDIELAYFGLMPEFIGRGFGPQLLADAIQRAWSQVGPVNMERLWLHTCSLDHPKALKTYVAAGFRAYRTETIRIEDPRPGIERQDRSIS